MVATVEAATLTVKNGLDPGGTCPGADCTLREAINAAAPGDTINFASGVTTITLTFGELLINKDLTITGPGANLLAVQRDPDVVTPFRIFSIPTNITVNISGLTISKGFSVGLDITDHGGSQ